MTERRRKTVTVAGICWCETGVPPNADAELSIFSNGDWDKYPKDGGPKYKYVVSLSDHDVEYLLSQLQKIARSRFLQAKALVTKLGVAHE